jgi:multidrug transporter EmrE-like cation transporter
MTNPIITLTLAIISEVIATASLRASDGFSKPLYSVIVVVGYIVAFYCVSLTLKSIPLGTTYAIWAGLGTAITAVIGVLLFQESVSLTRILGIALIVAGVVVLNLFTEGAHA